MTTFFSKIFGHKRLNRGGGYRLEIPVKYRFCCQEKIDLKIRDGKKRAAM